MVKFTKVCIYFRQSMLQKTQIKANILSGEVDPARR